MPLSQTDIAFELPINPWELVLVTGGCCTLIDGVSKGLFCTQCSALKATNLQMQNTPTLPTPTHVIYSIFHRFPSDVNVQLEIDCLKHQLLCSCFTFISEQLFFSVVIERLVTEKAVKLGQKQSKHHVDKTIYLTII